MYLKLTFVFGTIGLRLPKSGFPKPSFFVKSSGDPWLFSFPTAFWRFLKVFGFLKAFGLKVESLVLCLSSSGRVEPCPVLLEKKNWIQISKLLGLSSPEKSILELSWEVFKVVPGVWGGKDLLGPQVNCNSWKVHCNQTIDQIDMLNLFLKWVILIGCPQYFYWAPISDQLAFTKPDHIWLVASKGAPPHSRIDLLKRSVNTCYFSRMF